MAITLSDSINVGQQKALDKKLDNDGLTYANVAEVNSTLPVGQRHIGLTVQVVDPLDPNKRIEYWYQGGLNDNNLILKQSTIDQDNIDIFNVVNVPEGADRPERIFAINNLPTYTVDEKQSLWFTVIEDATFPNYPKTYKYKVKNLGKGTYGQGGTPISYNNLELVYVSTVTPTDVEELPTTQTINFGDIGSTSVSDYLNSQSPFVTIQNQNEGYTIFNTIESGIPRTYLWVGEGGDYGLGQLQSTPDDFQLLSDNAEVGNQDLQSVLENGSTASISEPLTITASQVSAGVDSIGGFVIQEGYVGLTSNYGSVYFPENSPIVLDSLNKGFQILGGAGGQISTDPSTGMTISGNAGGVQISGASGGVNILGGTNGFKYVNDESANYTDRSIPDVAYVNGLFNPQDLDSTLTNGNSSEIAISITDSISETRIDKSFLSLTNGNGVWSAQETGGTLVYSYNNIPKFVIEPNGRLLIANEDGIAGVFDPVNLTSNKTYQLPNNDGELALKEFTVPYTGATNNVDLGDYEIKAFSYKDNAGRLIVDEAGIVNSYERIQVQGTSGLSSIGGNLLTATRNHTLPDKSGTFAMLSDISALDTTPTDSSTNGVQSGGVKSYVDGLVANTFRAAGNWDASSDTFPTTGTGTAGAIRRGDTYKVSVAGNPFGGAEALDVGDSFYATVPSPGQTASNWAKFEANTAQATASFRGTARLYNTTGTNTDGAIDQNTVTTQLATKKNNYTTETGIPYVNNGVETWIVGNSATMVLGNGNTAGISNTVSSATINGYAIATSESALTSSDQVRVAFGKLELAINNIRPLTGSITYDFPSTSPGMSSETTLTVTGAAVGDCVLVGPPAGSVPANSNYSGFVSATNTVTIRFNNYSPGTINPASGTFKVKVFK